MTIILRQSTASQEIPLGYFVDSTDGDTAETGLTIANTDIKLHKTGATTLASKNSGGATHIAGGIYYAVLDATDTDTIGPLTIYCHVAGALAVKVACVVLDEAVFDVMFGTTALSTYAAGAVASVTGNVGGNVTGSVGSVVGAVGSVTGNVGGNVTGSVGSVTGAVGSVTTVSDKTGYSLAADQAVNATKIGGTTQTGRDLGASVLISSGTGTGQLDVTSGVVKANLAQILGTALTETAGYIAAAFKQFFNVASPTGTMKAITNVVTTTTATNLTNLPAAAATAAELAKVPKSDSTVSWNATALGAITTAATAATPTAAAVTGNVGGNVVGSVGSVVGAVGSVTGAVGSVTGAVGSVTGNVGGNVTGSIGSLAAQAKLDVNAEADTALADYDGPTNAEMVARTLAAAAYFDPAADTVAHVTLVDTTTTNTDMRGTDSAYTGTPPTVAAITADMDANSTQLAAIVADTNELQGNQGDWATADVSGLALEATAQSILTDTGTTLPGTLATIAGYVDTEVAAIKAKTDNLPASPAATGAAMTLTSAYDAAKTAATQTSVDDIPTNAELAAALGTADDATLAAISGLNNLSSAQAQSAAAAALTAYDPPTKAELDSGFAALNDFDPAADTVAHVTLVDTTTTNTDMVAAAPTLAEFVTVDTGETAAVTGSVAKIAQGAAGGDVTLAASQPNYAPAKAGDAMDLVPVLNATAVAAIQSGMAGSAQQLATTNAVLGARGNFIGVTTTGSATTTVTSGSILSGFAYYTKTINGTVWSIGGAATVEFYLEFLFPAGAVVRSLALRVTSADVIPNYYISTDGTSWTYLSAVQTKKSPAAGEIETFFLPADTVITAGVDGKIYVRLKAEFYTNITVSVDYLAVIAETAAAGGGLTAQETADAVYNLAPAGSPAAGSLGAQVEALPGLIAVGGTGAGAVTFVYTLTSSVDAAPIADADVWVTSDGAGSNLLASGRTDANGQVTFYLDAGTVYVWRQKSGWDFANPDTEVVA